MRPGGLETGVDTEIRQEGDVCLGVFLDRNHPGHGLFLSYCSSFNHREAIWNKVKRNSLGIFRQ